MRRGSITLASERPLNMRRGSVSLGTTAPSPSSSRGPARRDSVAIASVKLQSFEAKLSDVASSTTRQTTSHLKSRDKPVRIMVGADNGQSVRVAEVLSDGAEGAEIGNWTFDRLTSWDNVPKRKDRMRITVNDGLIDETMEFQSKDAAQITIALHSAVMAIEAAKLITGEVDTADIGSELSFDSSRHSAASAASAAAAAIPDVDALARMMAAAMTGSSEEDEVGLSSI